MAANGLVNGLIGIRIAHSLARLVFPFEVLSYTKEGVPGCSQANIMDSACLYSTAAYAQAAVYELAWANVLFYWRGDASMKAILFAVMNVLVAAVDAWSAQGADLDVSRSAEVDFSQKLALASILFAAISASSPRNGTQQLSRTDDSLLAQGNDLFFFICCFARLAVGFTAMSEPLEASKITLVTSWKQDQQFLIARIVAMGGVHAVALMLSLLFTPSDNRAGIFSYVMLLSTQVFGYMIDNSILSRMPESLPFTNVLAGHAFFVVIFSIGIFLLFVTWRFSGMGVLPVMPTGGPVRQEQKKHQ